MIRHRDYGDSDFCPIDGHGRTYAMSDGRTWCPHVFHSIASNNGLSPRQVVNPGSRRLPPAATSGAPR